ncbi:MAG: DUF58 domain-containing protein [Clostridia bacterium]|nr:DUF58 domain-containing protein [Clostridia bacterium]
MIPFILVGLIAAVLLLQFAFAPRTLRHLWLRYSVDTKLAEPGEKITFTGSLLNNWALPILYVNFYENMPEGASITGKKDKVESHSLFLLPHRTFRHTVTFTLPGRGVYRNGRYYVQTGDFLGFKNRVKSEEINFGITVMPKLCDDETILKILSGYIGDISVRRFIIEDPVLTIGYLDYTGREPMKKISWPHSAKTGRLMVKNSDFTADSSAAIVLNMASGSDDEKEKTFEIVRSVCERLEEDRIPYQFISNGDAGDLDEGFGANHINKLMTNLGRSKLYSFFSFDSLIERCIRERKRSRSYFIISPPLSEDDHEAIARLRQYSEYELCVLEAEVDTDADS